MKKRTLFIPLAITCIISLSLNVLSAVNYNNAKKMFLFDTYGHLTSISKILENTAFSVANGGDILNFNLSNLERECIQLDDSIYGLSKLSSHNITSYRFEDFDKLISSDIAANSNSPEQVIGDITQHNEKIQELIAKLSPEGKLSDNGYDDLSLNPNYSLSIEQITSSINNTLSDVFPFKH